MDDNEWETISPTQSDEDDVVLVPQQPSSIFSPNNHEGLPVTPPLSPSGPSSSGVSDETELANEDESESGLKGSLGVLRCGVLKIAYELRCRVGVWSIATMVVVVAVAAVGRGWQKWKRRDQKESRELLIHRKDEKIKQLLIQIGRMNELLSARRRVPVQRIVVDRPFINKQRLNWKQT